MKRINYVFLLLILFAFQSCSDQETTNLSERNDTSQTRNVTNIAYQGISVVNELFVAETNNDLKQFLHYLERGDTDTNLANSIYSNLGLNQETRSSLMYYTGNPAAYKFEEDFSFNSKRRVEEDAIFQKQQNGEDVFSIISKPYLKTIMNEYNAFKVGNRIFRELGEGHYVVVHNNDMAKYDAIKSHYLLKNYIHRTT